MHTIQNDLFDLNMFKQLQIEDQQAIERLVVDFPVFTKYFEKALEFQLLAGELEPYGEINTGVTSHGIAQQVIIERQENIVFVDFQKKMQMAPFVIYLNNIGPTPYQLEQLKAHLFPIIELCSIQKRDCYIQLATGERLYFPYGEVTPMHLNMFNSIKGVNKKVQLLTLDLSNTCELIARSPLPNGEILIVSANEITVEGVNANLTISLSAMFSNEETFEKSNIPRIEKIYFIADSELGM